MENFFKLKEHGTDVKTEVIAGLTTFMTMAYILRLTRASSAQPEWIQVLFLQQLRWHLQSALSVWHCLLTCPSYFPLVWV